MTHISSSFGGLWRVGGTRLADNQVPSNPSSCLDGDKMECVCFVLLSMIEVECRLLRPSVRNRYRLQIRGPVRLSKSCKMYRTQYPVDGRPGPALAATSQQTAFENRAWRAMYIVRSSAIKILNCLSTSQSSILLLQPNKQTSENCFWISFCLQLSVGCLIC